MTLDAVVATMAQQIAHMEGFYNSQLTIAKRNNNPGNLRSWGNNPIVSGYAQFPTLDAGWAALNRQITLTINKGLTFLEFFAGKPGVYSGYAPSADSNDPTNYARFVAGPFGVPITTRILDLTVASPPSASPPPLSSSDPQSGLAQPVQPGPISSPIPAQHSSTIPAQDSPLPVSQAGGFWPRLGLLLLSLLKGRATK